MANRRMVGAGLIRRTKGGAEGSGGAAPTPPPGNSLRDEVNNLALLTEDGQPILTEQP